MGCSNARALRRTVAVLLFCVNDAYNIWLHQPHGAPHGTTAYNDRLSYGLLLDLMYIRYDMVISNRARTLMATRRLMGTDSGCAGSVASWWMSPTRSCGVWESSGTGRSLAIATAVLCGLACTLQATQASASAWQPAL